MLNKQKETVANNSPRVDVSKTTIDQSLTNNDSTLIEGGLRYTPLSRMNFNINTLENWAEIRTKKQPKRRSFHSSFIYQNYLYVYGGLDVMTGKLNDMKKLSLVGEYPTWEEVTPSGVTLEPLAYQAGCLNENVYIIIGGQNKSMSQTNNIFLYDIPNNKLELITSKESEFPAVENHTANLYTSSNTKAIIIFGGFSNKGHTNNLFSIELNPSSNNSNISSTYITSYRNLSNNSDINLCPIPRINHSSVIIKETLLTFGGESRDGVYLNDMWSYDLKSNKWSEIKYTSNDIPIGRSGHSMTLHNDSVYIFGGKFGSYNETNDFWKYDYLSANTGKFTLLHDTLLEIYSEKELQENKPKVEDTKSKVKKFKVLTKRDIPALNPIVMDKGSTNKASKKKEVVSRAIQLQEFKNTCEKELLKSPAAMKMKKSIIFNLETDVSSLLTRIETLLTSSKTMSNSNVITGSLPLPRDGHSCLLHEGSIIIFGGDRNKFPFNDLHRFNI